MPDPDRLLHTLRRATAAFRATPGRQGRFVALAKVEDVLVAGDLHGNLANFKRLLDLADLGKHPRRHFVLQELIHGTDRYPDGGDSSHRLLDLLAALKCQHPERVHMLLGNHELSQWTRRAIMKDDADLNQLFEQGVANAYGARAVEVIAAYDELFAALPVAIRAPNRVFLSHSLPRQRRLETWSLAAICRDEIAPEDVKLNGSIHALVWNRDLTTATAEHFLRIVDADLLITGHIPCDNGYAVPNDRQVILDSMDVNGCACLFPAERTLTQADLITGIIRLHPNV